MQLRELSQVHGELRRQGVALHAICAEPGGTDVLKARLAERDTHVQIPVHSDPDFKLLAAGHDSRTSLFTKKWINASKYGGTYKDYMLVQPALVVLDKRGSIQQTWSWKTEPLVHVEPQEEMTPVGSLGGAVLVSVKPEAADIGASIREDRQVKLQGKTMLKIIADMPNSRSMSEFIGTLQRVTKSLIAVAKHAVKVS